MNKAMENLAEGEDINPGCIRPIFNAEPLKRASGDYEPGEAVDWTAALERLKRG